MSDKYRRVLEMLEQEAISIDEAERLIDALSAGDGTTGSTQVDEELKPIPKYLKMQAFDENDTEVLRMKVPMSLLRAGIKLSTLMPDEMRTETVERLRKKGVTIDPFDLSPDDIDDFIRALGDLEMVAGDDTGGFRLYLE